jgi:hypothetical protein
MTTITVPGAVARDLTAPATAFDRALLRTASALDLLVAARLMRRSSAEHRRALTVQSAASQTRRTAQALGAVGVLPR